MERIKVRKLGMKYFAELPTSLPERIAAITPKNIGDLKVRISLLSNEECLTIPEKENKKIGKDALRLCYVNMLCKVTNKTRSHPFSLSSGYFLAEKTISQIESSKIIPPDIEKAYKSGWTNSDISYDSIINGILIPNIHKGEVGLEFCPEDIFASTSLTIVVSDYNGKQFVGWFFYNENLDEVLNYTNYKI